MVERIIAYGHRNVTGRHRTTIEITRDREITKRADCIVGVNAEKGIRDLSDEFKALARRPEAIIEVTLKVDDLVERITGRGHPDLSFIHETDIVIRKSVFICGRTLMIGASKSSLGLNPRITEKLKDPKQQMEVLIEVK
jgi:hypothetical protein